MPEPRPSIRSSRTTSTNILSESPRREADFDLDYPRPRIDRSNTFQGPTQLRDMSPIGGTKMSRVPSENINMRAQRSQLRPMNRAPSGNDVFGDGLDDPNIKGDDSPDRSYEVGSQRSASPATSLGSTSRNVSYSALSSSFPNTKKQAPPPPPSRAKKPPPPPPPPMKRSALSTSNVSYA